MSVGVIKGKVVGELFYESFSSPAQALILHLEPAEAPGSVLKKGRLKAGVGALKIRPEPGVTQPALGYVLPGEEFEVLQVIGVGRDVWWRIGFRQHVAHIYNGTQYTEYV